MQVPILLLPIPPGGAGGSGGISEPERATALEPGTELAAVLARVFECELGDAG